MPYSLPRLFLAVLAWLPSLMPTPGRSQPDSLLRLTPARRYEVILEACLEAGAQQPGEIERLRQGVERLLTGRGSQVDRLQAQMAFLDADRHQRRDLERFPTRMAALLRQAEALGDTLTLARGHFNQGLYFYFVEKNYYQAFWQYGLAVGLMQRLAEEHLPRHAGTMYSLALATYQFFDYPRAIAIARRIHPTRPGPVENTHVFNAGLLGLAYYHLGRGDSARYFFNWGLHHLPVANLDNTAWEGIFNGNIGRVLMAQHQPDAARLHLEKGLAHCQQTRVWDNVAPFAASLSRLWLAKHQVQKALTYAQLANAAARRVGTPALMHEAHRVLADVYESTGQPRLALRHADSADVARQRWQADLDVSKKYRADLALAALDHRSREQRLRQERDRQVLLRNGLLGFVALLGIITWLGVSRQLSRQRQRQAEARAEQERTAADLRLAEARLAEFTRNVQEKSALIAQMSPQPGTEDALPATSQAVLDRLRDSVLLTDQNWEEFSALFERVHAGFFKRLTRAYPGLTPAEVRFAALTRLGYAPREMAVTLGVGLDTIRQHRRRLRRRLGLTEAQSLDEVIARV